MKVLVTGATGFIGRHLCRRLVEKGHTLVVLSRNTAEVASRLGVACEVFAWDPLRELAPLKALRNAEAVIHLAGESIASSRWTEEQKRKIEESRVFGTRHLMESVEEMRVNRPRILISTSAVGYYGNRGDELLTEKSSPGSDFLARVCQEWEGELKTHPVPGARTVIVRTGVVLGPGGGALERLVPVFKMGLGGKLGDGKQWMSWIHLEDLVSLFLFALENDSVEGVLNAVAPHPVQNQKFTQALGKRLGKPAWLSLPAIPLKLFLGELASTILGSQKVIPERALAQGFSFRYPEIEAALTSLKLA